MIKKLFLNPFLYFPFIAVLLVNNWDLSSSGIYIPALVTTAGQVVEILSWFALIVFAIYFAIEQFVKNLPNWVSYIVLLPYVLTFVVTYEEIDYWFTFYVVLVLIYLGVFYLCSYLSKSMGVSSSNLTKVFVGDDSGESNDA